MVYFSGFQNSPDASHQETAQIAPSEHNLSNVDWVHQKLRTAFPMAKIDVQDTRGDDQHLSVALISGDFAEKPRIVCHQMVYAALDQMRNNRIHALALRTQSE